MKSTSLNYQDLRYYSSIIKDYLNQDVALQPFYQHFPTLANFKQQIAKKRSCWDSDGIIRKQLVSVLKDQYSPVDNKSAVLKNIQLLEGTHTFTITTGHQLNLFTGPLYFLYKIISTINLCQQLKAQYVDYNFVPVYWMATEDHDFEEIQYFNYKDRKIVYDRPSHGAVGRVDTVGLEKVLEVLLTLLGPGDHAQKLIELFKASYLNHENLSRATRYLAHQLFGTEGLLILDADDTRLKRLAVPVFKEELLEQSSFKAVQNTLDKWPSQYQAQVNPREINLFYLTDAYRKRIIQSGKGYSLDETDLHFTEDQLLNELEQHPDRFSPNVIMRPLYQEAILPNLCYIGGGGELAYWLQLKEYFRSQKVTFPILLLRNAALIITEKQKDKLQRLDLNPIDLFQEPYLVAEQVTRQVSEIAIDLTPQKKYLKKQFAGLYDLAQKTEKSFYTAVAAQEQKQINGLEKLEKRLLKAQKRKLSDHVDRALQLQKQLFPNNTLQERHQNFSVFYSTYGPDLISQLKEHLDPLEGSFNVLTIP